MIFKNADLKDLPAIVNIYNSTIASRKVTADTQPVSVDSKLVWFNTHNPTTRPLWLVQHIGGSTIGWVSFTSFYGRPAYQGTAEVSIYLAENFRGMGYGKKILQHCIAQAPSLKIHTLLGYIFAHNIPSIQLFLQSGFAEYAHLKDIAIMDNNFYSLKIFGKKV